MRSEARTGEMELRLKQLRKYYGRSVAASLSEFTAAPGDVVMISGPNGAGKSTLLRMVCGICRPDAGEVLIGATNVYTAPERERRAALRTVGALFPESFLYNELTVRENLEFYGRLSGARAVPFTPLLEGLGIAGIALRRVRELSSGTRRKVALVRALSGRPEILLLDEPWTHLDEPGSAWLRSEIAALSARGGIVLVTGHAPHAEFRNLALPEGR